MKIEVSTTGITIFGESEANGIPVKFICKNTEKEYLLRETYRDLGDGKIKHGLCLNLFTNDASSEKKTMTDG